ncbi:DUF724 domain-containing protein 3 isoform X2 [Hevea brasiliensis]|uniref:DUF724 domain-containing protein 3 isoform X2 n=1 Tax=Hevea brasiliensis TaxID=3981 RepID=UPI0025E2EFA9|nr:DUF724 domain-containing protein 3 isoform X2 [Hevea brasiliensis]
MAGKRKDVNIERKTHFLSVGSQVEVSSDDEGFKGAWYVATILKSPFSSRKTFAKRKFKVLVQYHELITDNDENERLTEFVDASHIRPLPPPPDIDQSFEPHDVVDAFHRDGWWKAVVVKVQVLEKDNSKRYTVIFENPPEQFDFCSADLRFHWVWTDGNWVRPPKQKRMEGLKFGKGMAVEVSLNKENFQDAWFPAIVIEEVGFNSFLVECGSSRNNDENGLMREIVDSFHIRSPPPNLEVKNFEILETVDAFYDSSWRDGFITKILTDGRYNIFLKHANVEKQFSQSEIRPHLHLMNGSWDVSIGIQCKEHSTHVDNNAKSPEVAIHIESSTAEWDHSEGKSSCENSRKNLLEHSTPCEAKSTSKKVNKRAPKIEDELSCPSKKFKRGKSANPLSPQACPAKLIPIKTTNQEVQVTDSALTKCSTQQLVDNAGSEGPFRGENIEPNQQEAGLNSEMKSSVIKGELNSQVTSQWDTAAGREDMTKGDSSEVIVEVDHIEKDAESSGALAEGRKGSYPENSYQLLDEEINLQKESDAIQQQKAGELHNVAGDGANEMNFKHCTAEEAELCTVIGFEPEGKEERQADEFTQSSAINVIVDSDLVKIQTTPFVKSSPIWKNVESLEAFQSLPQNPHFSPLIDCKEASREGSAIGHMLTFATVVDKTSKLHVDDPRMLFYSYLETLADLEMLGFDVKAVVDRLNKLLSIKDRQEQLQDQSKNVDIQIAECDHEKAKVKEDIDAIDKKLREIEEQRAMKVAMKVMKDSEIIALQEDANAISEDIVKSRQDFESLAAAPW